MLTWINAGCDVGLGLPKCQAMHPTSVLGQKTDRDPHLRRVRSSPAAQQRTLKLASAGRAVNECTNVAR
jgi:hypothetical protein